jgi:phosphatidate phosphatase APP1
MMADSKDVPSTAAQDSQSSKPHEKHEGHMRMPGPSMAAVAGLGRQWMQEDEQERETRTLGKFNDFESTMPILHRGYSGSLKDKLTSYMGSKNPFYSKVKDGEHKVWLFDNTAFLPVDKNGEVVKENGMEKGWQAEFVAAYFVKHSGKDISLVAADIAEKVGLGKGHEAEATIAKRLEPFLDQILPAHSVTVQLMHDETPKETHKLGPSSRDGISSDMKQLDEAYANRHILHGVAKELESTEPMRTFFAGPTGWAIISDVDDTIKKTMTSDPAGILQTTFVDDPEPIDGMPELYKYMSSQFQNPPFFYLSASPYNLYSFLREFRDQHYPHGQLILREASWMTLAGFFVNLTQGTKAYKTSRIDKIHSWLPARKFICIGDSTQTDPESYGEMYRRYPGWVKAIFIRKVTGVAEMDESKKNTDERFEKAFKDVPADVWTVFEDPNELKKKVDELVTANKRDSAIGN